MFVTDEELVLVKEWTQSASGPGCATYKYLSQFAPDDPRIVFIDIDVDGVERNKTNENNIKMYLAMAVTEQGFCVFKEIYNELKASILHPLSLKVFFMNRIVCQKHDKDTPFAFSMAIIEYDVKAGTKQYAKMLTDQYVSALAKAFQKGYSK